MAFLRHEIEAAPTTAPYRWVMLGLVAFLYFSFGLVQVSLAPLLSDIQGDLDISDALAGAALAAWQLVYVFFAIPAGATIERIGLRRGLAAAGIIMALSALFRALAFDYPSLFLGIAAFGLGGPLISIGAPATVARWFSAEDRAVATGIYSVAPAVGGIIALFTANSIFMPLTGDSWRLTLAIFGSIAIIAAAAWILFARDAELPADMRTTERTGSSLSRFLAVGRIGTVQIMLFMSIGIFLFSHGSSNWLPTLLHRQGMSEAHAGNLSSLPTIFGVVAALTLTRFVRKGQGRDVKALMVVFVLGAIAAAMVPMTDGAVQLFALIIYGFGLNASTPLMMIMLMGMPRVGPRNMGIAGGLWFTFGEIGGVLGPTTVGTISEVWSLSTSFYMLSGVSLFLALVTMAVLRPSLNRDSAASRADGTLVKGHSNAL